MRGSAAGSGGDHTEYPGETGVRAGDDAHRVSGRLGDIVQSHALPAGQVVAGGDSAAVR